VAQEPRLESLGYEGEARGCRVRGAETRGWKASATRRGARLSGAWRRDPRLESLGYEERREVVGWVAQEPRLESLGYEEGRDDWTR